MNESSSTKILYDQAIALYKMGRLGDSASRFSEILVQEPDRADVLKDLGLVLLKLRRYDEAVAVFDKAIGQLPQSPVLLVNRGIALKNAGRSEAAIESYKSALSLEAQFPEAHYNLANALFDIGRFEEALGHYKSAIAQKPTYSAAHLGAAEALLRLELPAEAKIMAETLISMRPDEPRAHAIVSHASRLLGDGYAAIAAASQALRLDTNDADSFVARAMALDVTGNHREAIADYCRALEIAPHDLLVDASLKKVRKRVSLDYHHFINAQIKDGALASAKTLQIITTKHTEFVGRLIARALRKTRLKASLSTSMPASFSADLFVVVAPQMFKTLPPSERTIFVQMEQVRASSSRWITETYLARLTRGLAVLDYSCDNISALTEQGLSLKQLYYVPILPVPLEDDKTIPRDIDVLFYGAINSDRRRTYIDAISKAVNLRVETDTFGPVLHSLLRRAKIVVNCHFYENALLETTRISEALSHGCRVVSETAADQADHTALEDVVDFVPAGEVEAFVKRTQDVLAQWQAPFIASTQEDWSGSTFHVLRALNGCGIISVDEFLDAMADTPLASDKLILAMPEAVERYQFAIANRLPGFKHFHCLRNVTGWKGTAESYRFLATKARSDSLPSLCIYEDDAAFTAQTPKRLDIVYDYLREQAGDWDVFSGLLTDLSEDSQVINAETYHSEEFIHLDSVIGMVFGIYNSTALDMLSRYRIKGEDTGKHTIDRYLESLKPHCITTIEPIAEHCEDLQSTLWRVNNSAVSTMISKSLKLVERKKNRFRNRTCLMVLGMHRSGTSALARTLNLLGADLPEDLVPAGTGNEAGHWEPRKIVFVNEKMLSLAGSSWEDHRRYHFERIEEHLRQEFQATLRLLFKQEYADSDLFVLKDPRICRFTLLYRDILDDLGINVRPIIIHRHPHAVIQSLKTRDGMEEKNARLCWLRHVVQAEVDTRDLPRAIISYEELLNDWRRVVAGVVDDLGLRLPAIGATVENKLSEFLSRDLDHSQGEFNREPRLPGRLTLASRIDYAMHGLALNDLEDLQDILVKDGKSILETSS